MLEQSVEPARALRIAEAYLAEERKLEALAFLRLANAADRLDAVRADAVQDGDAFLLREVARVQARPATREEWRALAASAESAGRERYAEEARRQAGREGG
jgi:hypothetical protein